MLIDILIGAVIFGYALWTLIRFIKRSKKGKCATCELKSSCSSNCASDPISKSVMLKK